MSITSKPYTPEYGAGWERIFGKKKEKEKFEADFDHDRSIAELAEEQREIQERLERNFQKGFK